MSSNRPFKKAMRLCRKLQADEWLSCYNILVLDRTCHPAKPLITVVKIIHVIQKVWIGSLVMPDDWAPVNQNSDGNTSLHRALLDRRPC
jgi:hypothetical protein